MNRNFSSFLTQDWQRKLIALFVALFLWFVINQTIMVSKTIPDVSIRIVDLPEDKIVNHLMPDGYLDRKLSLTVTGNKTFINSLTSLDFEVVISAKGKEETWIETIEKKNLVSLIPDLDIKKRIHSIQPVDLLITLSERVSDRIPVKIEKPIGDPPKGFQFLQVWPTELTQKISGPIQQVQELKKRGLTLTFNLDQISASDLEDLIRPNAPTQEIMFKVPKSWKEITIPFPTKRQVPLNDPKASLLRLYFLKQELIPLPIDLPITIFFPVQYSNTINPQTYSLKTNEIVQKKNGLKRLTIPLFAQDVSQLFLDVVQNNLLLIIVATPNSVQEDLRWVVEFIDEKMLEDTFVKRSILERKSEDNPLSESALRAQFRNYIRKLAVYTEDGKPLDLSVKLLSDTIIVEQA